MRIFEDENDSRRIVAYNAIDTHLIDRHHEWCRNFNGKEKIIYLIFFLTKPEEIAMYKSNRLENKFCIMYELPSHRDDKWIVNFCNVCYSADYINENRYDSNMKWPKAFSE